MSRISLTIVSPTWIDDRGALAPDWDDAEETTEEGWLVQPVPAEEATAMGRQGVTTMLRGFGPEDTIMTEHDRLIVNDVTYEVDGAVRHYSSITGGMAHAEVMFKRVEG